MNNNFVKDLVKISVFCTFTTTTSSGSLHSSAGGTAKPSDSTVQKLSASITNESGTHKTCGEQFVSVTSASETCEHKILNLKQVENNLETVLKNTTIPRTAKDEKMKQVMPLKFIPQLADSLAQLLKNPSFYNEVFGVTKSPACQNFISKCETLERDYNRNYDNISSKDVAKLIIHIRKFYSEANTALMNAYEKDVSKEIYDELRELDYILTLLVVCTLHYFNIYLPLPQPSPKP